MARPEKLTTNHHAPWALIRRAGDTLGKRPSTRMARGLALAFTPRAA